MSRLARAWRERGPLGTSERALAVTSAALLALAAVTGLLLTMQFRPTSEHAHASILAIDRAIPYGSLLRGVHVWSSHGSIVAIFGYLVALCARRGHRVWPLWSSAVLALGIVMLMALTGAMLPWSEQAGANAAVAGRFSRALPFVGRWLETFVLGGSVPTSRTLERAFGFHAALLPAALTAAVSLHVVAIAAAPTGDGHRSRRIEAAAAAALAATVVLALAMTWPPVAGEAFDVARATSGAKPLWFAWPIHALLAVAPTRVLSVDGDKAVATGVVAVLTALLALPFLRKPSA